MRRDVGILAIGASFIVGLVTSHGCADDRARVRSAVFQCNPSSSTADGDCGAGFTCYSAAQSFGTSVCVPACDPTSSKSCLGGAGLCTQAGACLTRCTVPGAGDPNPCPTPLLCRRITDSALERAGGPDGLCLPINQTCSSSKDCTSAIFDKCTSEVTGATQGPGLLTTGEVCVEGGCFKDGIACEPGSACIKDVLPDSVPVPDVCSPLCNSIRDRSSGSAAFNECTPGLTCLSDAFPQTRAGACAPGFPGWICVDQVGCAAGACETWSDVDPAMADFLTCTPHCKTDADCVPFDRGTNPNLITHFTCQHMPNGKGWCRNLSSLFFPLTCLHNGDRCELDDNPNTKCVASQAAQAPDGGAPACSGALNNGAMGLGAFGGNAASCRHPCSTRSDCNQLATNTHVPMSCQADPSGGTGHFCAPIIPFVSSCGDDSDCMGGLHCLPIATGRKTCTLECSSSADCAGNNALGSNFACVNTPGQGSAICRPKVESGCSAATSDLCLSGMIDGTGKCVSPPGWACNAGDQCASGNCAILADTLPPFGRCM